MNGAVSSVDEPKKKEVYDRIIEFSLHFIIIIIIVLIKNRGLAWV